MFAMIVIAVIGQLKVGDHVYIQPGASLYRSAENASSRSNGFERPFDHGPIIAIKEVDGEKVVRFKSEGYEIPPWTLLDYVKPWNDEAKELQKKYLEKQKATVDSMRKELSAKTKKSIQENEILLRLLELDPYTKRAVEAKLKTIANPTTADVDRLVLEVRADDKQVKFLNTIRRQMKPFLRSKLDSEAFEAALAKGFNPLNMTPKEAQQLTTSQRKALSELRRRYKAAGSPTEDDDN